MPLRNLQDLFIDELKDTYDCEHRISKALPRMIKTATHKDLVAALEHHLAQTEKHITRLEQVFSQIGEAPARKTCQAAVGLLKEGEGLMEEGETPNVTDAGLIAAAQKVEHYEMATYGCLRDWARMLGHEDAVKILQSTLDEEGDADRKLTRIAQGLNLQAMQGDGEDDTEREEATVGATRRSTAIKSTGSKRSHS